MSLIIDLALLAVILLCAWRGFRTGIINGVAWIAAIIVAIYGANLISTAYSNEFSDMLEPFAIVLVDNALGGDSADEDDEAIIDESMSVEEIQELDVYDVSMMILRKLGFTDDAAEGIAAETAQRNTLVGTVMTSDLAGILCGRLAFVGLFAISFALIAIIFTVIGNVFDLAFGLPGHENLNHITGAALGVIRGIMIVMVLACLARYMGALLPDGALSGTFLLRRFMEGNRLAALLGI